MKCNKIFARRFSPNKHRRLGPGAFIGCFIIAASFCMAFQPYLKSPLAISNLQQSMGKGLRLVLGDEASSGSIPQPKGIHKETEPPCKVLERTSDYCDINGDVRIHGRSSTVFVASAPPSKTETPGMMNQSWTIQPYARKGDPAAMKEVTKFSVNLDQPLPDCTINHSIPAVVFSLRGYAGNLFHDFTDTIIPLYMTSQRFNGEVQFIVTNMSPRWVSKFHGILTKLSNYKPITIDGEEQIHCFPGMNLGLYRWNGRELNIDAKKSSHSMTDFRDFLRHAYSLNKTTATRISTGRHRQQPRMLIISRQRSRKFMNEPDIATMARKLGFDVMTMEAASNVSRFAWVVNSCDVLIGVHGAGLTNMVFLPKRAVVIQVVPLGLEWIAKFDFEKPAEEMNLRYLEYRIRENESTLGERYPNEHRVFRDPSLIRKMGWDAFKSVYLEKQDVKLDVGRFRATLSEALKLLHW